jgi:DNA-binding NarL/FixJ family response regulator
LKGSHVNTPRKARILLAEDHETVREGLKLMLNMQADMEVIGEAGDGATAIERATALHPDVVVLDISMPGMNGLHAAEALRHCCPSVKVLTLTRHSEEGYLHQLLRAGVSGYVLKQSRPNELLHAIRSIIAGGNYLDPAVAGKVIGSYGRRSADEPAITSTLSGRESEVLRLIAWGYSNKEIAARFELSVKTVETHKANAMHKLGMSSRIDIVRYALLQGWLQDT